MRSSLDTPCEVTCEVLSRAQVALHNQRCGQTRHHERGQVMNRAMYAVVCGFAAIAALYSWKVPPWEAPDEVAHFKFVKHLVEERRLPVQKRDVFGEEHQAPLYYLLAAVPVSLIDLNDKTGGFRWNRNFGWEPGRDVNMAIPSADQGPLRGHGMALRIMRLLSIALATGTVVLTGQLARAASPDAPGVAVLAMTVVAFNPQFAFVAGAASNDNLLILCITGCLMRLVQALNDERPVAPQRWRSIGWWMGAALLAKASAMTMLPVVGAAIALRTYRDRDWKAGARASGSVVMTTGIVAGWWFLRNLYLYGDPFGLGPFRETSGLMSNMGWRDVPMAVAVQFRTFWGMFGWLNIPAPSWFYALVMGMASAGVGVVGYQVAAGRIETMTKQQQDSLVILVLAVVVQEILQLRAAIGEFGDSWLQGRYLFATYPAGAVVVATMVRHAAGPRIMRGVVAGMGLVLCGCAVYMAIAVIGPAYGRG